MKLKKPQRRITANDVLVYKAASFCKKANGRINEDLLRRVLMGAGIGTLGGAGVYGARRLLGTPEYDEEGREVNKPSLLKHLGIGAGLGGAAGGVAGSAEHTFKAPEKTMVGRLEAAQKAKAAAAAGLSTGAGLGAVTGAGAAEARMKKKK